jgi:hypothetical protein
MQNNLLSLILFILIFSLSSCATYRNGQTPDDVYFADALTVSQYVIIPSTTDRDREDRQIRMQIYDPRFRGLYDPYYWHYNSPFLHQPSLFGFGHNNLLPLQPNTLSRFTPPISTTIPTVTPPEISKPKQPGKMGWTYPSNNNSNSNTNTKQQSGSRYFSENSGSKPSSPRSSGNTNGGTRSGRRN